MSALTASGRGVVTTDAQRTRKRKAPGAINPIYYVILIALVAFSMGPIVLSLFAALKTQSQLAADPLGLPTSPQWGNFLVAWTQANMAAGFLNSIIIVGGTVIGVSVIAGLAAYAMARLDLPFSGGFMGYLLVSSALPIQLFLVPLFFLWTKLGLYDTQIGLIIIYCATLSPFATLLLRSFMISIPRDFDDAARIDGAGELRVLFRIVLPIAWPGFLTIALITALDAYNEFLLAQTFIQSPDKMPVSIALYSFREGFSQNYVLISAAGWLMLLPMFVLFLILQRRFVDGISASGLTG
ncbi:carbohydrate ABC transporter permease [Gryllotalpicola protaetiae]|uniref:Carbohydrate ABC transporter permease n=1 Tax=Gryllotalpicola protaetiae TaxID=2419771 RepID=A0A387BJH4_9MICO|nr:carbohydrate ABC transporter permease [Gryllotalpicola protaetiae]AYG02878.1 carbohydrate ABC transporter permease [Gryllotalpicola protaetiae]